MVSSPPTPPNGATTNLPPEVLRAMMQGVAQSPAFQAPRGIKGLGTPAMRPPSGAPPVEEAMADEANAAPDAAALQAQVPTEDVEGGPNRDEDEDRDIADLGYGDNPIQGPAGHSDPSFQHPLDRAATSIRNELLQKSKRLAGGLFPQGPAGSAKLSRKAMLDYVARHWDDPSDPGGSAQFRQTLLDRVAPKGPDGTRLASGVRTYLSLYRDAVVEPGKVRVAQPPPPPAPQGLAATPVGMAGPMPAAPAPAAAMPPPGPVPGAAAAPPAPPLAAPSMPAAPPAPPPMPMPAPTGPNQLPM